jgi:TetR/AcrR family transcriptional repressor of bet genes
MPKVGMEPIRRRQLIAATIASIHEEGLANTTLSQISRRAGLSAGIVSHYFQDKAGLLEATMRSLTESLRRRVIAQQADAHTPEERVFAVIDASFAPDQCAPEVVTAWLSFWSQVGQSATLARIQAIYERRLASNLLYALNRLLPGTEARRLAAGLAALIDGLWLRCALTGGALAPDDARAIARDYFTTQLAASGGEGQAAPANGELKREKGSKR